MKKMLFYHIRRVSIPILLIGTIFSFTVQAKSIVREGKAIITLGTLDIPDKVQKGEIFFLNADFSITKNIWEDYGFYLHIVDLKTHAIVINNDFSPATPTTMWVVGDAVSVGPVNVFIPSDIPAGEYGVRMGLYSTKQTSAGPIYIREPYTNADIKDFIVGTLRVVEPADENEEKKIEDLVISDFEDLVDVRKWELSGAVIEQEKENVAQGKQAAKITFNEGGMPTVRLNNFFRYSNPKYHDWLLYDELRFYVYGPEKDGHTYSNTPLTLQIKDRTGRRFTVGIPGTTEKDKPYVINLSAVGEKIDLGDIDDFNFYRGGAQATIYLDDVWLVSFNLGNETGPFVTFEGTKLSQNSVRPGGTIDIELSFSISRKFKKNYALFMHIYRQNDKAGYINADSSLIPQATEWKVGEIITQGPKRVYIPDDTPPGIYDIEAGLFIEQKTQEGASYVRYYRGKDGVYQIDQPTYPSDTFKQPYVNYEKYGDWVVGTFTVE
ncbi:MAG: hypothetical protein ABIJ27_00190 [Candidatus Omnitrophota bacterium]